MLRPTSNNDSDRKNFTSRPTRKSPCTGSKTWLSNEIDCNLALGEIYRIFPTPSALSFRFFFLFVVVAVVLLIFRLVLNTSGMEIRLLFASMSYLLNRYLDGTRNIAKLFRTFRALRLIKSMSERKQRRTSEGALQIT